MYWKTVTTAAVASMVLAASPMLAIGQQDGAAARMERIEARLRDLESRMAKVEASHHKMMHGQGQGGMPMPPQQPTPPAGGGMSGGSGGMSDM